MPRVVPKETDLALPSSNQMPTAPSLGAELCAHVPSSMLGFLSELDWYRPCACCHYHYDLVRVSALLYMKDIVFRGVCHL